MNSFRSAAFPVIVILALVWATLLLCDVSRGTAAAQEGWPALIDRLMAVPIELTEPSDLRVYAVPVCLALLLVLLATMPRPTRLFSDEMPSQRTDQTAALQKGMGAHYSVRAGRPHSRWFEGLVALMVLGAAASAWWNGTWEISRGYVFFLTAFGVWAVVLSRSVCCLPLSKLFAAGAALAVVAVVLSLWHLYALGERFFQLPVGPITLTAAFGALWGAMAIAWVLGVWSAPESTRRHDASGRRGSSAIPFRPRLSVVIAVMVAVLALWMAWEAGRRGAFLAFFAAIVFSAGLIVWTRFPSRRVRGGIVAMVFAFIAAAGGYVWQQSVSPERVASVPLLIRYTYWAKSLEMVAPRALFGHGPDMFICDMTTELARQRAEMPQILHGTVDFNAHNEWVQAIFELGVPIGLVYTALPLIVLLLAVRGWTGQRDPIRRAALLACIAGLVCIVVAEASSINLRGAMLATWYWTILGLTAGLIRSDESAADGAASAGGGAGRYLRRGLAVAAAVALMYVVGMDLRAAMAHARGRGLIPQDYPEAVVQLEDALGRFGAAHWLSTRTYLANSQTAIVRRARFDRDPAQMHVITPDDLKPLDDATAELAKRAVETWTRIHARAAGYLDTGFRLAEAQMLAGDTETALVTLRDYLHRLNPYDKRANSMLLRIGRLSPREAIRCVLQSLRADHWDSFLLAWATELLASPRLADSWPAYVATARDDVTGREESNWQDSLAPEVLRVEAFRLVTEGDLRAAANVQFQAARAYRALWEKNARVRRLPPAEADAWYLAARFLFDLNPGRYDEAHQRITLAERFAVQDVLTDKVRRPPPGAPYVGGEVMPLEFPERLRDIWRFSAMMQLAVMGDPQQISLRIKWSLPPDRHSTASIQAELGVLAAELVQRFAALPEERRPPSFPRLVELAKQYAGTSSASPAVTP